MMIWAHPRKWYPLPEAYCFVRDYLKRSYPGVYKRQVKGRLLDLLRRSDAAEYRPVYAPGWAYYYRPSSSVVGYRDLWIGENRARLVARRYLTILHVHVEDFGAWLLRVALRCEFCGKLEPEVRRIADADSVVCLRCRDGRWAGPDELLRVTWQVNALQNAIAEQRHAGR